MAACERLLLNPYINLFFFVYLVELNYIFAEIFAIKTLFAKYTYGVYKK